MDLFATVSRLPFSVLGPHRSDTCTVDRLNYKYTVGLLVFFSIVIASKQFSNDQIQWCNRYLLFGSRLERVIFHNCLASLFAKGSPEKCKIIISKIQSD